MSYGFNDIWDWDKNTAYGKLNAKFESEFQFTLKQKKKGKVKHFQTVINFIVFSLTVRVIKKYMGS